MTTYEAHDGARPATSFTGELSACLSRATLRAFQASEQLRYACAICTFACFTLCPALTCQAQLSVDLSTGDRNAAAQKQPVFPSGSPADLGRGPEVAINSGGLVVTTHGSSLVQILSILAEAYSFKISGSVTDETVFGVYGPGDMTTILLALLKGSGNNVLIIAAGVKGKGELILSPRTGAVTPSTALGSKRSWSTTLLGSGVTSTRQPREFQDTKRGPNAPSMPYTPGAPAGNSTAADTQPSTTTLQRSPNGIKLPDEIKASLHRLQDGETAQSTMQEGQIVR